MKLLAFVLGGYVLAFLFGLRHLEFASWYHYVTAILLAIGLYSSTYGIVLHEAKMHARLIVSAVTIGVFLKALFIGGSLFFFLHDPFYLILGVLMAQIDPLSVSSLMRGSRLSAKAKTILASWSSFDDPITVIMALSVPLLVSQFTGQSWPGVVPNGTENTFGYLKEFAYNISFAGGVFVLWFGIKRYGWKLFPKPSFLIYGLLASSLSVAVSTFWMLSVALIGLFIRPPIESSINRVVTWALSIAALLLGMLLLGGIDLLGGVWLGIATFSAQIIVGFLLTHGLPKKDRIHLAFAQQNGITAIILALLFAPVYPATVAIVAPAILVVNTLHVVTNRLLDRFLLK